MYFQMIFHKLTFSIIILAFLVHISYSLITYSYVSLPDNSISLDTNGAIFALLVLFKLFIVGSTGVFPIHLNDLLAKRKRRSPNDQFSEQVIE